MTCDRMAQMSDVGGIFHAAYQRAERGLGDLRRIAAAYSLAAYPDREGLRVLAEGVRADLATASVEVNVVLDGHQRTIATAPGEIVNFFLPTNRTLCAITVGTGMALAVDDVEQDVVSEHLREGGMSSWASVPVLVEEYVVGTVCAIEFVGPRVWSLDDQARLEEAARVISARLAALVDELGD